MGPGTYDVNPGYRQVHERKPTYRFGSSQRNTFPKKSIPGPGAYNSNGHLGRSIPRYSFGGKFKSKYSTRRFTPGPGTYYPKVHKKKIQYTMRARTGIKKVKLASQPVGPGTYEVEEVISKPKSRVIFPKSKRFKSKKKLDPVGPGTYELPSMKGRIAYSMRPKTGWNNIKNKNPGPGHYFPKVETVFKKCTLPVFGKEIRGKENKKTFKNVGPGSYNPNLKKTKIEYSFGKNKRSDDYSKHKNLPGPGYYDIKSFLECYPAYATWKIN